MVWTVIEQLDGKQVDVEVEMIQSLHEYEIDEKDLQGFLLHKNVLFNQKGPTDVGYESKQPSAVCDFWSPKTESNFPPPRKELPNTGLPSAPALTLPSHASLDALPPQDLFKRAFPIVFSLSQLGHVSWNPADFTLVSAFRKSMHFLWAHFSILS